MAGVHRLDHVEGLAAATLTDDDAVGKKEVGDGGAFAQKFGIGSDVEGIRAGAVAQDDAAHPITGVDGNCTFLDHDFVLVDAAGNFAGHGFDVGQIGFSAFGGRRADGDEDDGTEAGGCGEVVGESQALPAMAAEQFGQEFLMNGDLAVTQRGQFLLIVVDQDDVVAEVGKARAGYEPNVS